MKKKALKAQIDLMAQDLQAKDRYIARCEDRIEVLGKYINLLECRLNNEHAQNIELKKELQKTFGETK